MSPGCLSAPKPGCPARWVPAHARRAPRPAGCPLAGSWWEPATRGAAPERGGFPRGEGAPASRRLGSGSRCPPAAPPIPKEEQVRRRNRVLSAARSVRDAWQHDTQGRDSAGRGWTWAVAVGGWCVSATGATRPSEIFAQGRAPAKRREGRGTQRREPSPPGLERSPRVAGPDCRTASSPPRQRSWRSPVCAQVPTEAVRERGAHVLS